MGRRRTITMVACAAALLAGCAGRDPANIATVQPQDRGMNCAAIQAEMASNNARLGQLSHEEGEKVAQNVAAGVVGLLVWPVWFAMDFKDAAGKDTAALQNRQQYLTTLAADRCSAGPVATTASLNP